MSSVIEDNISGSYIAVNQLYNLGYKQIGFIGSLGNTSFWERYMAYKATLERLNLPFDINMCITDIDENPDFNCIVNKLKNIKKHLRAFVCCNDKFAALSIKAAYTLGFEVPKDIGIVGFDNNEIAQLTFPTITTIDTSRDLQGTHAVKLLWKLINNKQQENLRIVLHVKLVQGNSIRKLT